MATGAEVPQSVQPDQQGTLEHDPVQGSDQPGTKPKDCRRCHAFQCQDHRGD